MVLRYSAFLSFIFPLTVSALQSCQFVIVQWATEGYRKFWASSFERNKRYAEKHSYDYVLLDDDLILLELAGRPAHWGKILALQNTLHSIEQTNYSKENSHCEYLLWLDADCFIVNFEQRLESFISLDNKLGRVVQSPDCKGNTCRKTFPNMPWDLITTDANMEGAFHVNNGAFLLRNSKWSRKFLQIWWQQSPLPNGTIDWFSHDQGGFWNALLLSEFPGLYDDQCARGQIPFLSYLLSACVDKWLQSHVGVVFRERRFEHTLLIDPYRHLRYQELNSRDKYIRGLHFWSALSVATKSMRFHACHFQDHFEAGDFIVQTKNPMEEECGGPCWANAWMGTRSSNNAHCQQVGAPDAITNTSREYEPRAKRIQARRPTTTICWDVTTGQTLLSALPSCTEQSTVMLEVKIRRYRRCLNASNQHTVEIQSVHIEVDTTYVSTPDLQRAVPRSRVESLARAFCGFKYAAQSQRSSFPFVNPRLSCITEFQRVLEINPAAPVELEEIFYFYPGEKHQSTTDIWLWHCPILIGHQQCGLSVDIVMSFSVSPEEPENKNTIFREAAAAFSELYNQPFRNVLLEIQLQWHKYSKNSQ